MIQPFNYTVPGTRVVRTPYIYPYCHLCLEQATARKFDFWFSLFLVQRHACSFFLATLARTPTASVGVPFRRGDRTYCSSRPCTITSRHSQAAVALVAANPTGTLAAQCSPAHRSGQLMGLHPAHDTVSLCITVCQSRYHSEAPVRHMLERDNGSARRQSAGPCHQE